MRTAELPAAALAAAALLIGACGLPFPSTLPQPVECSVQDPDVLSFCGTSTNFPFRGYEIYYKLIEANEATPAARHVDRLRADFGRLSSAAAASCEPRPPLVRADGADSPHTVFLDLAFALGSDADPALRLSWRPGERVPVRRGIAADDGACRRFAALEGSLQRDVTGDAAGAIARRGLVDIVVYAVSFGIDRGQHLYSAPLLVGRKTLSDL